MGRWVEPATWQPHGLAAVEPAAEEAIREESRNALVVAGPGAGKTELLAQRACYLLQTGVCRAPRRILAISFKRDAARNLRRRVELRCGPELSRSFDSYTFDGFAKGLLDRFRLALPPVYRPDADYEMALGKFDNPLGLDEPLATSPSEAVRASWRGVLGSHRSRISFLMVGRLAELILRSNPFVLRALRASYAFVFLDEFQDTSGIHYDLTSTAFRGSDAILSAVGDNKQRIMLWAGALDGVFGRFQHDFSAPVMHLLLNHRSAPRLVSIQQHLARAIHPDAPATRAATEPGADGGECRVLLFRSHNEEASHLAALIEGWLRDGLQARDIVVLTRNRPGDYTARLCQELAARGLAARNENELQDLLVEPVTEVLTAILRLATGCARPDSWQTVMEVLAQARGAFTFAAEDRLGQNLGDQLVALRARLATTEITTATAHSVLSDVLEWIGRNAYAYLHPQYSQGTYLDDTVRLLAEQLAAQAGDDAWEGAVARLEGDGSVPVMTIHKSKGLEYHTVVFIGLEDSAWFGYKKRPDEETCAFFVAFSRAKERVVFTYCEARDRGDRIGEPQSRRSIGALYDVLQQAGVEVSSP